VSARARPQTIAQIQTEQRDIDGTGDQFQRLNTIEKSVELARLGLEGQKERAWDQNQQPVCGNDGHPTALALDQRPRALARQRKAGPAGCREGRNQMANTLTRMERDGLIQRRQDPNDGRAQRVWLTEAARALEGVATAAAESVNSQALAGLAADERMVFLGLIRKVITGLQ